MTSTEESTVVMVKTETSEEAVETNTDAIMQTSSDEEVKSRNNLTLGVKLILNMIKIFLFAVGHKTCVSIAVSFCFRYFRKSMVESSGSEIFQWLMNTVMQIF